MQSIPLAVLKLENEFSIAESSRKLHAIHTACGIETPQVCQHRRCYRDCMQSIPLAVLKHARFGENTDCATNCMQSIPLAVLKRSHGNHGTVVQKLHAIHTACGIETRRFDIQKNQIFYCMQSISLAVLKLIRTRRCPKKFFNCMQSIPLAVLKQISPMFLTEYGRIACNPYRLRY